MYFQFSIGLFSTEYNIKRLFCLQFFLNYYKVNLTFAVTVFTRLYEDYIIHCDQLNHSHFSWLSWRDQDFVPKDAGENLKNFFKICLNNSILQVCNSIHLSQYFLFSTWMSFYCFHFSISKTELPFKVISLSWLTQSIQLVTQFWSL